MVLLLQWHKLAISAVILLSPVAAFAPTPHFATKMSSTAATRAVRTKSTISALSMSSSGDFDFDVAIIGCGVGGHGAALHSRAQGLSTAVFAVLMWAEPVSIVAASHLRHFLPRVDECVR